MRWFGTVTLHTVSLQFVLGQAVVCAGLIHVPELNSEHDCIAAVSFLEQQNWAISQKVEGQFHLMPVKCEDC